MQYDMHIPYACRWQRVLLVVCLLLVWMMLAWYQTTAAAVPEGAI